MNQFKRFSAGALLCAFATAGFAGGSGVSQADACWRKGFIAGDTDAVTKCYAADAIMWIPGLVSTKGAKEIHDGYAGYFDAYTVKDAVLKETGSKTVGDDSVAWGTYSIVVVPKAGGAAATETGRYTEVAKRIGGKWVYVVDHASIEPTPPVAAKP